MSNGDARTAKKQKREQKLAWRQAKLAGRLARKKQRRTVAYKSRLERTQAAVLEDVLAGLRAGSTPSERAPSVRVSSGSP